MFSKSKGIEKYIDSGKNGYTNTLQKQLYVYYHFPLGTSKSTMWVSGFTALIVKYSLLVATITYIFANMQHQPFKYLLSLFQT